MKRHLRKLGQLGLVAFKDSANGKRFGRRNAEGQIVEAYGFDLTPLAARAGELAALHSEIQAERAATQQLRQKLTQTRRSIRAKLVEAFKQHLEGPWKQLEDEFSALLDKLPCTNKGQGTLQALLESFALLQERIETLFATALGLTKTATTASSEQSEKAETSTPSQFKTEPHIQITNQSPQQNDLSYGDTESELPEQDTGFTFQTFCLACPRFIQMAQEICGPLHGWEDLVKASQQMGLMLGISKSHWQNMVRQIGIYPSAIALGLTFEKHVADQVHNPAGYLSGMAKKAKTNELHLNRSIFGRLIQPTRQPIA